MVSKGCLKAIEILEVEFPDLVLVAISGNMCTDKKPSAINWILGYFFVGLFCYICIF
jgi:hydroxymethylglutaryl-CoA reductase (NADPH)